MTDTRVADVIESFKRCQRDPAFLDRFYALLFERRPDVAEKFDAIDMDIQRALIRKAVTATLMFAVGARGGGETLDSVRLSHGAGGLDVSEGQYRAWLECFLETVEATDRECGPELLAAWRRVLTDATRYLIA